jgi:hypothetical protein
MKPIGDSLSARCENAARTCDSPRPRAFRALSANTGDIADEPMMAAAASANKCFAAAPDLRENAGNHVLAVVTGASAQACVGDDRLPRITRRSFGNIPIKGRVQRAANEGNHACSNLTGFGHGIGVGGRPGPAVSSRPDSRSGYEGWQTQGRLRGRRVGTSKRPSTTSRYRRT